MPLAATCRWIDDHDPALHHHAQFISEESTLREGRDSNRTAKGRQFKLAGMRCLACATSGVRGDEPCLTQFGEIGFDGGTDGRMPHYCLVTVYIA